MTTPRTVKTLSALTAALALMTALAGQALAVPLHLHCMEDGSGTVHPIAGGATFHAPHDTAFHNVHFNVHLGAFAGTNPHQIEGLTTLVCPEEF
jgi:hypothetical protein